MARENDIVLIHIEDSQPFFARIESILPDVKKDWFHVKLLVLQIPMNSVTWILRDIYINGQPFKMNGKDVVLEHVPFPLDPADKMEDDETEETQNETKEGKVISFDSVKKKKD